MVLFSEAETLLLLDMYGFLRRQRTRNVTAGGLLLRQHARRRLTRAMNRRCAREPPWTEAQLAVKVKNLRGEFAELRWLARQPGFDPAGAGLSAAWWASVKARRPKAHAFKGKLPWPFERRVALLVGDLPPAARVGLPVADERAIAQLMDELEAEELAADPAVAPALLLPPQEVRHPQQEEREEEEGGEAEQQAVDRAEQQTRALQPPDQQRRLEAALAVASIDRAAAVASSAPLASPSMPLSSRKRVREQQEELEQEQERNGGDRRSEHLAGAVQQSSAAAAGMARGLQELVGALQEQSARYGRLLTAGGDTEAEHQRRVVLSVARALEQSTRAAADMALGFHDLVRLLARERAAEGE